MYTIALDEQGDFENLSHKRSEEPVFIGGVVYDDCSIDGEEAIERERIEAYYQSVIEDAALEANNKSRFTYPEALHSNGNPIRDYNVVRFVKRIINTSLAEFIRYGTYKGDKLLYRDRKGKYYIFVILKSDLGKTKLLNQNANILAKDDFASNLYFHMADELISRLIFNNPLIDDIEEISLDIATRRSAPLDIQSQLYKEYKELGYKDTPVENSDKIQFILTNPDIYRSVIAKDIMEAKQHDITITHFNVTSIGYRKRKSKGMEFLYMADSICSILGFDIKGSNADAWLDCVDERVKKLTGEPVNLVFGYDEIDNIYSKAWAKYIAGDYCESLSIVFDACKRSGGFARYYKDVWFKKIEEEIVSSTNVSYFNMAVRKLYETLDNNRLDQDKCLYILKVLEKLAPDMEARLHTPEAKRILYKLFDIGVSAYCHIGDSKGAYRYYEKCNQYAEWVSLDDYLRTRNKLVVVYCDCFEFDRATELSDENVVYQELLTDMKNELKQPGVCAIGIEAMGKVHSQRGQVYAFKRDSRAKEEFLAALEYFEEGSANYKITQSYLLHYYLDSKNVDAYLAEAKIYFGGKTKLIEQLQYIINEGSKEDPLINMKYALYVYVRALYMYRLPELSDRVWSNLQNVKSKYGKKMQSKEWTLTGHPSEIIYKYMRLIAISRNEKELEEQYASKMSNCLKYAGPTENVVCKLGEIEVMNEMGKIDRRDELSLALCDDLADNYSVFADCTVPTDGETRYKWLDERITFMYR